MEFLLHRLMAKNLTTSKPLLHPKSKIGTKEVFIETILPSLLKSTHSFRSQHRKKGRGEVKDIWMRTNHYCPLIPALLF